MPSKVLILNRHSGTKGLQVRLGRAVEKLGVREELARVETANAEEAVAAARAAALDGARRVIVAGGDGSVQAVVRGLVSTDVPEGERPELGIVPAGRGNDLVRNYGIPFEPEEALGVALGSSKTAPLDVGLALIDGAHHVFVNALGIGFDGEVAIHSRSVPLGGLGAYAVGIARTFLRGAWPWHLDGEIDSKSIDLDVTLLSIGNGGTTGGGFQLTPGAEPGDGKLDACVMGALGRAGIVNVLPRVKKGTHTANPKVSLSRFRTFGGRFDPPIPIHADGEILAEAATVVHVTLEASALRVVRP